MIGQTIILAGQRQRETAHRLIEQAPAGAVLNVREAQRTSDQNAKLWAMLSDVARAKPQGRVMPTENWKALFMQQAGFKMIWEPSLDGTGVVPIGWKSSRLTKAEFGDLIEALYAFGAQNGIVWSDPQERQAA